MVERIEYFFFVLISALAHRLTFRTAGCVGALLGRAVFSFTNFRKSITLDNLRRAFPEKSKHEIATIARRAFRNYGIALVESLWTHKKSEDELRHVVQIVNPEVMNAAVAKGKGVLFLSGHYGSWELLVSAVRLHFATPFAIIVQEQRNLQIDALIDAHRSRFGNTTIPMGVSARRVIAALAEGKVIALLGDQSGPREAVFVEFFGRPAATHRGVAAFSVKTGAPIIMGFLVRQDDGTYRVALEEVDRSGLSSGEEGIVELTRRHVAILETWIRKHPDHWLWMHKRWKHTEYFEQQRAVEAQ